MHRLSETQARGHAGWAAKRNTRVELLKRSSHTLTTVRLAHAGPTGQKGSDLFASLDAIMQVPDDRALASIAPWPAVFAQRRVPRRRHSLGSSGAGSGAAGSAAAKAAHGIKAARGLDPPTFALLQRTESPCRASCIEHFSL